MLDDGAAAASPAANASIFLCSFSWSCW